MFHLAILLVLTLGQTLVSAGRKCKAVPGTADWPCLEDWNRLNASIGGRLLQPPPPGAVCHPDQPTYNAASCDVAQSQWHIFDFHTADPISNAVNNWNNDTCLPYPQDPCSGLGYPVYVINATTAEHVKAGVKFARKNNIRIIVKGSGCDFIGRSVAPYSLSIWTHFLNSVSVSADGFQPHGCRAETKTKTPVLTAGAGATMYDVVTATAPFNQTVIVAGGYEVGLGGYLLGGAHGLLSTKYGLAADSILEMEVVTSTGDIVTANECQNQDLFWAMRGGGGPTFGIMTAVTIKTHPSPRFVYIGLYVATPDYTSPEVWDVFAYILSQYPSLSEAGISGYSDFYPATTVPYNGANITAAVWTGTFGLYDTQDTSQIIAKFQPILDHINATWPDTWMGVILATSVWDSFWDWYEVSHDTAPIAGNDFLVGSWLLDEKALAGNLTATASAWKTFLGGGRYAAAYLVSGPGVHHAVPAGGSDSVLPAWRKAYVHAVTSATWSPLNSTMKAQQTAALNSWVQGLRDLAPDMGAYFNEANPYEPNWQHTFWGDNYARLLKIKKNVDPNDVFWCHPCIGNEGWEEVGDMLCRV